MRREFVPYQYPYNDPNRRHTPSVPKRTDKGPSLLGGFLAPFVTVLTLTGVAVTVDPDAAGRGVGEFMARPNTQAQVEEASHSDGFEAKEMHVDDFQTREFNKTWARLNKYKNDLIRLGVDPSEFEYNSQAEAKAECFGSNGFDSRRFANVQTILSAIKDSEGLEAKPSDLKGYIDALLGGDPNSVTWGAVLPRKDMLTVISDALNSLNHTGNEKVGIVDLFNAFNQEAFQKAHAERFNETGIFDVDETKSAGGDKRSLKEVAFGTDVLVNFLEGYAATRKLAAN